MSLKIGPRAKTVKVGGFTFLLFLLVDRSYVQNKIASWWLKSNGVRLPTEENDSKSFLDQSDSGINSGAFVALKMI